MQRYDAVLTIVLQVGHNVETFDIICDIFSIQRENIGENENIYVRLIRRSVDLPLGEESLDFFLQVRYFNYVIGVVGGVEDCQSSCFN